MPPIPHRRIARQLLNAVLTVAVLAGSFALLAQPAQAQSSQTDWLVNDDPRLDGPPEYWYPGQAGKGHGSNNYVYTFAIGGDPVANNVATWDMGSRLGQQELQVFVPCNHATATVYYEIKVGGSSFTSRVNQLEECGNDTWTSLGTFGSFGQNITVVVEDTSSDQHVSRHGRTWSSIGVDAIRAKCTAQCGDAPPSRQTDWLVNDEPRLDGTSEYWYSGQAGKGYGRNNYVFTYAIGGDAVANNVATWNMESRVGKQELQVFVPCNHATATVYYEIRIGGSSSTARVNQLDECGQRSWTSLGLFDADGQDIAVVLEDTSADQHASRHGRTWSSIGVDAIRAKCTARCSPDGLPGLPTHVEVQVTEHDVDGLAQLRFEWQPPGYNGGSPITGYRGELSRVGNLWGPFEYTPHGRVQTAKFRYDTEYVFTVSATNSEGQGTTATLQFTIEQPGQQSESDLVSRSDPMAYPERDSIVCGPYKNGAGQPINRDRRGWPLGQCTAYVMWRLFDAGVSHQLWCCGGDAGQWDTQFRGKGVDVDEHAAVGSVAQWEPFGRGARSYGHVAYVEAVNADGSIVVWEMNFDGRCGGPTARTISPGDNSWPDHFIHFERTG